ncbi:hypothetical protein Y032_0495g2471 [Ancylostoma ceylanicum]|nr:hypothetical protein Y032_0495g2471 [Ancylostoma ceylanicum]
MSHDILFESSAEVPKVCLGTYVLCGLSSGWLLKGLGGRGSPCKSAEANSTASCIHRLESSSSAHFAYHLGIVLFCVACLAVTAYSYSILLRVISGVVKAEIKQSAELEQLKDQYEEGERRLDNKHVLKRHKYVVVIGTVIGVYSVYLTAYATLQVLQLVNINSNGFRRRDLVYLKYICYLCISLHSLLQPLCYLRMREFRMLIKR